MKSIKQVLLSILAISLLSSIAFSQNNQSLFMKLSTDSVDASVMGINFAHMVLKEKSIPVTIFLNVTAVRLADKNQPQFLYPDGRNPQEMLKAFMADGGQLLVCPMCMKNVAGLTKENLIAGAIASSPELLMSVMFADGTVTIDY